MALSANYLVAGTIQNTRTIYIYELNNNFYERTVYASSYQRFGTCVDLTEDDNGDAWILTVDPSYSTDGKNRWQGGFFIFKRNTSNGEWDYAGPSADGSIFKPSTIDQNNSRFSDSQICITNKYCVIGAPRHNTNSDAMGGEVYIFNGSLYSDPTYYYSPSSLHIFEWIGYEEGNPTPPNTNQNARGKNFVYEIKLWNGDNEVSLFNPSAHGYYDVNRNDNYVPANAIDGNENTSWHYNGWQSGLPWWRGEFEGPITKYKVIYNHAGPGRVDYNSCFYVKIYEGSTLLYTSALHGNEPPVTSADDQPSGKYDTGEVSISNVFTV
jgi:hypothetical protein